MAKKKKKTE